METVREKIQAQDWGGARDALDQVKAKNPNQENLWSMYGFLAEVMDVDYPSAIADFRKELALHPDSGAAVMGLADAQTKSGDSSGALKTLQAYYDAHQTMRAWPSTWPTSRPTPTTKPARSRHSKPRPNKTPTTATFAYR